MINILTGPMNSGKTTGLVKLYEEIQKGDGFVSIKNMEKDKVLGFDIMSLSSKEKRPLVVRKENMPEDWNECCSIGPYSFSKHTVSYVEDKLRELMNKKVSPIFLDEIGLLELQGKCFHNIFKVLKNEACDLYITVRDESLFEVIEKYQIKHKRIIWI